MTVPMVNKVRSTQRPEDIPAHNALGPRQKNLKPSVSSTAFGLQMSTDHGVLRSSTNVYRSCGNLWSRYYKAKLGKMQVACEHSRVLFPFRPRAPIVGTRRSLAESNSLSVDLLNGKHGILQSNSQRGSSWKDGNAFTHNERVAGCIFALLTRESVILQDWPTRGSPDTNVWLATD